MPPKNGNNAGDAGAETEQVTLYPVTLAKPARINGVKAKAGETVEVDATVGKQLHDADALDLEETEKLNTFSVSSGNQA
jgi:hypothetical protein